MNAAPLLELAQVTMQFGGLTAVSDFTLSLGHGEMVGLIGPNGAGKTTLFNLLTGVYTPTHGTIHFIGQDIATLPPHRINHLGIARTFQNIRLFGGLSVLDNVLVAMHRQVTTPLWQVALALPRAGQASTDTTARAMALLEQFGLADQAQQASRALPYGLQRRLEIVRALATQPQVLLLDEPAAGMNPTEKKELIALIRQLHAGGLAIALVEHDMHVVMTLCPRLFVLDYGVTIATGTPDEIRRDPRVIEAYLGEKYHE